MKMKNAIVSMMVALSVYSGTQLLGFNRSRLELSLQNPALENVALASFPVSMSGDDRQDPGTCRVEEFDFTSPYNDLSLCGDIAGDSCEDGYGPYTRTIQDPKNANHFFCGCECVWLNEDK